MLCSGIHKVRHAIWVQHLAAATKAAHLACAPSQSNAAVGVPSVNLAGGCACCTVHGDLVAALKQLASHAADVDYMVGGLLRVKWLEAGKQYPWAPV